MSIKQGWAYMSKGSWVKRAVACGFASSLLTLGMPSTASAVADPSVIFGDKQQQKTPPYMAPHRMFSVRLPPGWEPRTVAERPDFVELRMLNSPGTAWLQVQRIPVSEGARAKQLLLRALELRLKKLPHFAETGRRDIIINGIKGASLTGSFWYQGNAEYPRAIEEIYIVIGKEAFELHFECFEPLSGQMAGELDKLYQTFVPRPPQQSAVPMPEEEEEDPLDNIPF